MHGCNNTHMLMNIHATYLTSSFDYDERRQIVARQPVPEDRVMQIEFGSMLTKAELMTATTDVKECAIRSTMSGSPLLHRRDRS